MRIAYLVGLCYVALAATVFVFTYHVLARWWETQIGRNIMLLMGSIAATLDLGLVNLILGRPDWMRWVLWVLYLVIGTAIWWRLYLLVKAQHASAEKVTAQVDAQFGDQANPPD